MRILVSNDDGIYAEGINTLADTLKKQAKVVVVAPDREQSATSHSLTLHRPLRIKEHKKNYYAIDGTPTDAIMLGVNNILKKRPDLIVSGINHGANLGYDVHYSGTVSAAMEGAILGIPSIAVSLANCEGKLHFSVAANFVARLIKSLKKNFLSPGVMLNVNVPNLPKSKIKGHQFCILGRRKYGDVVVEKIDPRGKNYYWIGGDQKAFEDIEGSDCNAVFKNYIALTPLNINFVHQPFLEKMKEWKI